MLLGLLVERKYSSKCECFFFSFNICYDLTLLMFLPDSESKVDCALILCWMG